MAKTKQKKKTGAEGPALAQEKEKNAAAGSGGTDRNDGKSDFLCRMSYATPLGESLHWFQLVPAVFFGAVVIMITRMHSYQRNMAQFYWSSGSSELSDFFSYYKMVAILICAALALIFLLYRLCTQSLGIKKSFAYIPMIVYAVMVIISYICCDYKEFSWLGYNDRFEGTLPLLAYMVMLFFIINTVNGERNAKVILYSIGVSSAVLGLIGISQALDHDFFRTTLGQKLLLPNNTVLMTEEFLSEGVGKTLSDAGLIRESSYTVYQLIDLCKEAGTSFLNFTFQNREIYQTVYNINYVSFYLTLLLPLFGMLFIRSVMRGQEEAVWKKILLGILFALLVYNLIGSASSGGWFGMGFAVLAALLVLNKRILHWWKPVAVLLVITIAVGGITYDRWIGELTHAVETTIGSHPATTVFADEAESAVPQTHHLQYFDTVGNDIIIGIDDNTLTVTTYPERPDMIKIVDQNDQSIKLIPTETNPVLAFDDERFANCYLQPAQDELGNHYYLFTSDGQEMNWAFRLTEDGVYYLNSLGKLVDLDNIPHFGFENNPSWGTGRGYIFSRTFPMMKDTILIGHGADTYCLYFPHKDYVGKYNAPSYREHLNIIVDKPHDLYLGAWIGTGGVSVLALLTLFGGYLIQSFRLYFRRRFEPNDFASFAGAGIFLGVIGFLTAALVDDSTVSVMPMFYTLLGTGIALNILLRKRTRDLDGK